MNYSKIYPLYKIPEREVELARKLIFHDTSEGDPLQVYMAHFSGRKERGESRMRLRWRRFRPRTS